MPLQECNLHLSASQRELFPHGTADFPCAAFHSFYSADAQSSIAWHWHDEMELIYLKSGALRLQTPDKSVPLRAGELFFINSNILHFGATESECEIYSLVFHPMLVGGAETSVFAQKYMNPLKTCSQLDSLPIKPESEWQTCAINHFLAAFEAEAGGAVGFEFAVRERLSSICLALHREYASDASAAYGGVSTNNRRVQTMLDFIHAHYTEDIAVCQIAAAAGLGERECLRCFQRVIQQSPLQYLIKYRVTQGAVLLLQDQAKSISDIALRCGFDSPSHFSQMFRRVFHCTPRAYRARFTAAV